MDRILIVDDKEENLYLLRALLHGHGYQVEEAHHGAEALIKARQNPPHLVISDLLMPVMDGYTLLRHWRLDERLKSIPFVVYTATYTEPKDERLAFDLGADMFIIKPTEPDIFIARLQELFAKQANGTLSASTFLPRNEDVMLKQYNEVLIRRLEIKMEQQAQTNRELERELAERKLAEQTLANKQTLLSTLLNNLPVSIYVKDSALRKTLANQVELRNLGAATEAEALGKTDYDVYPQEQAALFSVDDQRVIQTGQPLLNREEMLTRPDGSVICLLTSKVPLRDASGNVVGLVGIGNDITEYRQAQVLIREQAALLDAANDAIYVQSLDQTVRYWNHGAERIYGWTSAEAMGHKIIELGEMDTEAFQSAFATLQKQGAWSGEMDIINRKGASLTLFCRWTLLRDQKDQPKSVLAINTDITQHKLLEAEFLRAQRLEGIGALASGIAHDLNNILSPMLMMPSFLENKVKDAESKKILKSMENCAKRGTEIVKQLLNFARGTPGARIPLILRHLISDMNKIVQETFPRDISSNVSIPGDLWLVVGDATQIHQALMNLCVNARDAMPKGGTLTMSAENVTLDEMFVTMTAKAKPGPYVCITVSDTGAGIAPENLKRIFAPFFTTKEIGKGTGLGLSTVLGIVRGHEGFVRVNSQMGRGATFKLYFPASPKAQIVPADDSKPTHPKGHGELILVVDDEDLVRDSVCHTLERHGYRVLSAADGTEGLVAYFTHRNEVRALLTDMMMPVMNGSALIAALRSADPLLPMLGMTGLPDRASINGLKELNLSALLIKPFSGDELLRVLHIALH